MTEYFGKSGFSAHSRSVSHRDGVQAEAPRSALWQHAVARHGKVVGEDVDVNGMYSMTVLGNYSTSSRRLISEAIYIEDAMRRQNQGGGNLVLNSARQWFQPGVIRSRAVPGIPLGTADS